MNDLNTSTEATITDETAIGFIPCYAQVFLGDCLELYKNIEPKSIDLILTDLPYGTTACKWDTIIPFDKLWEMVNYLLKPNGAFITTASQPFTSALIMSNPKMFKYELIWQKTRPSNVFNAKKQFMKWHENICIFYNNLPIYNPQTTIGKSYKKKHYMQDRSNGTLGKTGEKDGHISENNGIMQPKTIIEISNPNHNSLHPTQKPVALFEYLLKTYSNEGMTIFDPCMGSGTTGVACKNTNRYFIGIEKDEAYFKIAEQRINARTLFS